MLLEGRKCIIGWGWKIKRARKPINLQIPLTIPELATSKELDGNRFALRSLHVLVRKL
jgi:hypothetical protein